MKNKKSLVFGIALILAALGLLCMGFFPELNILSGLPVWKIILGILLLLGCVDRIFFAEHPAEHFDCIFLLGLMFILFEKEIGTALGKGEDFVNNWLVIGASLLLTFGIHALLPNDHKHKFEFEFNSDDEKHGVVTGSDYSGSLSENSVYFDLSEKQQFTAENKLGQLTIHFQNEDMGDFDRPVELNVRNELGEMDIVIPDDWNIDCRINNSMGSCNVKNNDSEKLRKVIISGSNRMGEVNIRQ